MVSLFYSHHIVQSTLTKKLYVEAKKLVYSQFNIFMAALVSVLFCFPSHDMALLQPRRQW